MSQVKLDLTSKSIADKLAMGNAIGTALGDPAPAPYTPLAADLKAKTAALQDKKNAVATAQAQAEIATGQQDVAEADFDKSYGALGRQVQTTTGGDSGAIMATGYAVRSEPTELDYVENFSVTTTNTEGVLDFAWDRSKGEVMYEIRGHKAGDAADTYAFTKTTTKTRLRGSGFESGVDYTFEIRAHGANEVVSPWCDPFVKKAS